MQLIPGFIYRKIAHRPDLIRIVDNVNWLFIDKFLSIGVGLFVGVWVARYLGPDRFGLLSFAAAFTGLFGAIAQLGLKGIVVRDIVRHPSSVKITLGTASVLHIFSGLLAYGVMNITIYLIRPEDTLARLLVAILGFTLLLQVRNVALYWFESQVQSKYIVWVQNSSFLVFALIKIALILTNAPLIAFAWSTTADILLQTLLMLVLLRFRGPRLRQLGFRLLRARELLSQCWPLLLSGMLIAINLQFDQIMITTMVSQDANGVYAVGAKIPQLVIGFFLLIESSLYPKNIQDAAHGKESLMSSVVKTSTITFYLSVVTSLLIFILAGSVLPIIYGDEYVKSVSILKLLSLLIPLSALVRMQGQYCQITGKTTLVMYRQLLIAIFNIFLNWLLLPRFGAVGAAYAILISFLSAIAISSFWDDELGKIPILVLFKPNFSYLRLIK